MLFVCFIHSVLCFVFAVFDEAGIDLAHPVVATCYLGSTACGLAGAAHILGKENVPVYYVRN